jgi:hypothetical protein
VTAATTDVPVRTAKNVAAATLAAGNPTASSTASGCNPADTLPSAASARGAVHPVANETTSRRPTVSTSVRPFDCKPAHVSEPTPGIREGAGAPLEERLPDGLVLSVTGRGAGTLVGEPVAVALAGPVAVVTFGEASSEKATTVLAGPARSPADAQPATSVTDAPATAPPTTTRATQPTSVIYINPPASSSTK